MKQAIAGELGNERAKKIAAKAIADYADMYGVDFAQAVLEESTQDFTVVEY